MFKRFIALVLSGAMALSVSTSAFASTSMPENAPASSRVSAINEEVLYVDDGEGNRVKVIVEETVYTPIGRAKVGETRTYSVKISNEAMGLPSIAGGAISLAAKKKAAQMAANAIAAKVGSNFVPGLNVVSYILGAAAWANAVTGKAGITITVNMKYTETYMHNEGYAMGGWNLTRVSISRY